MAAKRKSKSAQRGHARAKRTAWHAAFLTELAKSMNVREAARVALVDRNTAYKRRETDTKFAAAWDKALDDACDAAEAELYRRSVTGVETPTTVAGKREVIRNYSDSLLTFMLRAHRPAKYRETTRTELTGADGGPLQVEHDASDALLSRLERLTGGDKSR